VDVSANIVIHPVIVKYDVPKYEHECQFVGGTVTDSACQNNPGWKNKKIFAGCETKTETYTDQIAFATIDADLSPASIRWITTDLASKYPGAHVYQAHWSLWPGRSPSQGGLAGDGASLSVVYANLPLADPGTYGVQIQGRTTARHTRPRARSPSPIPICKCICWNRRLSSDSLAREGLWMRCCKSCKMAASMCSTAYCKSCTSSLIMGRC
jgi:hypothetical protein